MNKSKRWTIFAVILITGLTLWVGASRESAASPGLSDTVTASGWRTTSPSLLFSGVAASPHYAVDQTLFAAGDQLLRSQDGGASWQTVLDARLISPYPEPSGGRFTQVRISPAFAQDETLFAAYTDGVSGPGRLYRSLDGGNSWRQLVALTQPVRALRISPTFAQDATLFVILGGGQTVHRSTDGGANWSEFPFDPASGFVGQDLALSPNFAQDGILFAAGFGPSLVSRNQGESWQPLNAPGPTYGIALSPNFATDLTLWQTYRFIEGIGDGTPDAGVIRSQDGGASWHYVNSGLPGAYEPFPRVLSLSPNYAQDGRLFTALSGQFVGGNEHTLFASQDQGESWMNLGPAPGNPDVLDLTVTHHDSQGIEVHLATANGIWHYSLRSAQSRHLFLPLLRKVYPAPSMTPGPTLTATPMVSSTGSPTPSSTSTGSATPTETASATSSPTASQTRAGTGIPTLTATATPSKTSTKLSTGTATPSATATPTATSTATSEPLSGCSEGFVNGSFENNQGWQLLANPAPAAYVTSPVHTGGRSVRTGIGAGGANVASYSPIQQRVTFPAQTQTVELRFWRYAVWGDGATRGWLPTREELPATLHDLARSALATDFFYVIAIHPDGAIDWLLVERTHDPAWQEKRIEIPAATYAGQEIRFQLGTYNGGSGGVSRTYVDDVTLSICAPAAALTLPKGWADRIFSQPTLNTLYASVGPALYRSDDAGASWRESGSARPEAILLTANPDHLYAGSGYPCYMGGPATPMWRSVNSGAAWQEVTAGVNLKPLAAHPTNPDWLYAAGCDGPYLSRDGGASFVHQAHSLFGVYDPWFIAPIAPDWQTVWVGGISEGGGGAVLVSRDGGVTWSISTVGASDPGWLGGLMADRFVAGRVYASSLYGFNLTLDNGQSWGVRNQGLSDVIPSGAGQGTYGLLTMAQSPIQPERIHLGTVRGLYGWNPANSQWEKVTGQPFDQSRILDLDRVDGNPATLFVTGSEGVYRLQLKGERPTPTPTATSPVATATATLTATPTRTPTPTFTPTATGVLVKLPTAAAESWPTPYLLTTVNLGVGSRPHGVAVHPDGTLLYVALHGENHGGNELAVVGVGPWQVAARIPLAAAATGPNGVALMAEDGRLAVTNRQTNQVTFVDTLPGHSPGQIAGGLDTNLQPNGVAVLGAWGYTANFGSDSVTVFDPASLSLIRTLTNVGQKPAHFALDPGRGDLYLSAYGSHEVVRLRDGGAGKHIAGIPSPYGLAFDEASRRLYVASRGNSHTVTVVDAVQDQILGTIDVGREPFALAVNPDSGHLFVACGDQVRVYGTLDWSLVTVIPVPAGAGEGMALHSGSDRVFVTSSTGDALSVIQDSWPPLVLFTTTRDGNPELYRMLPDGREQMRLTRTANVTELMPAGSPDGRWIAYSRWSQGNGYDLWIMSRDGRNGYPVVQSPDDEFSPRWSGDGGSLVFSANRDQMWQIRVVTLADGAVRTLMDNTAAELFPDWSWATGRIAFQSNRNSGGNPELFRLTLGREMRQISFNVNGDAQPGWSPDGQRLVFYGNRIPATLYTMNQEGGDVQAIVPQSVRPGAPAWGPAGRAGEMIVFGGYRPDSGHSEILRVKANGEQLALLTQNEVDWDYGPGWLPGR